MEVHELGAAEVDVGFLTKSLVESYCFLVTVVVCCWHRPGKQETFPSRPGSVTQMLKNGLRDLETKLRGHGGHGNPPIRGHHLGEESRRLSEANHPENLFPLIEKTNLSRRVATSLFRFTLVDAEKSGNIRGKRRYRFR
jgi:hypothetical protein